MAKALWLGLSMAFFTGYSLIATALFVPTSTLEPVYTDGSSVDCSSIEDAGLIVLPGDPCYKEVASGIPIIGGFLSGVSDVLDVAGQMFSGFFQLVTFQTGFPAASFLTLLIFVPLFTINAFIIFGAIRGNG
jgi:hypothetical protein